MKKIKYFFTGDIEGFMYLIILVIIAYKVIKNFVELINHGNW